MSTAPERPRLRALGPFLGLICLIGGSAWLAEEAWFGCRALTCRAVVVEHTPTRRGNGKALVAFDTPTKTVRTEIRTLLYLRPQPGDMLPVAYRVDEPRLARIDTFSQRYLIVLLIVGLAGAWNCGNAYSWWRRRATTPAASPLVEDGKVDR